LAVEELLEHRILFRGLEELRHAVARTPLLVVAVVVPMVPVMATDRLVVLVVVEPVETLTLELVDQHRLAKAVTAGQVLP
jgi:hypothetical protein